MSKPTIAVCAVQGAFIEHERRLGALGCDTFELRQASDFKRPFDALVLPGGESTVQAKLLRELNMFDTLRTRIEDGLPVLGTCAGLILLAERIEEEGGDLDGLDPKIAAVRTAVCGFGTLPVTVRRNGYGRQLGSFRTYAPFGNAQTAATSTTAKTEYDTAAETKHGERHSAEGAGSAHNPAAPTGSAEGATNTHAFPVIPMTFIRAPFITKVNARQESIDGYTEEVTSTPANATVSFPAANAPTASTRESAATSKAASKAASVRVLARVDDRIVAVQSQNQIGVAFHPELDEDNTVYQEFLKII